MKQHYENDHSSCTVKASPTLPDGTLELSNLLTDASERRQGYATQLMQAVCHDADIERVVLVLTPSDADMHAFYKRFGFTAIQKHPVLLARLPKVFMTKYSIVNAAALTAIHG